MEQLTLLCAKQSGASSSAWKVPADMPQDNEQLEARNRWDFLTAMALSSLELAPALQPTVGGALDMYFSFHLKNLIR